MLQRELGSQLCCLSATKNHGSICSSVCACAGEHVGALAMSEPNAGSDVASMRCRAGGRTGSELYHRAALLQRSGTAGMC